MTDPTTILDYATRQRDDAMLAVAAAQRQLGEAQSAIAAESRNLARATGAFSDLNKQADVAAKQAALAVATQSAIVARIDPEIDANVIAARTALTEAENALKIAEDNYKQSDHGVLHAWEAAVPETSWLLLADYEEARRALNDLKASDPAKLKSDLDQAEADFVEAKLKADASSNVMEQLASEQTRRAGRRQSARQNHAQRLFGALRGDN